ncbi:MAG: 2,3,4,5-tetrahydropyridine-2,6-dicarboxylate N-succinyltransferase [Deltaproteobacteria bacterium]|nr:2,3,4,5-tetrahydropyridine-2,6-dicarboxylate N-succinyltransferase [Deltaproteobacteria bacterium]
MSSHTDAVAAVLAELDPFLPMSAEQLAADDVAGKARIAFRHFLGLLEQGHVRAASLVRTGDEAGTWTANPDVKKRILFGFRLGRLVEQGDSSLPFVDKDTYPVRGFTTTERVRVVPGGSSVRRGAHVAAGVTIMPPAYINVGAFVDEGTLVDSHALVGSCAQIGKRVHLSAAAQIGGVLEPVGAVPVVIEDDVLVGGNCGVYEGTIVRARAVLAAGVVLTSGTRVFDLVNDRELLSSEGRPLEIPAGAVVVPGSRPVSSSWGKERGLHVAAPMIVKYRDEKTDAKAALESVLRA